jgi:four helix bundle protein
MNTREVVTSSSRQVVRSSSRQVEATNGDVVFSFEQLEVYQAARAFKKRTYALARLLPDDERYRLRMQMRKAGLSLTNAIAEGHGRHTYKDKRHYCHEARGSLQELADDINDCIDQNYAKTEHLQDLRRDAFRVLQLIDGWARWLAAQDAKNSAFKKRKSNASHTTPSSEPLTPLRLDDLTP